MVDQVTGISLLSHDTVLVYMFPVYLTYKWRHGHGRKREMDLMHS